MSSQFGAFPHSSSPLYQSACQALVALEQVALALHPTWQRLGPEMRQAGLSVVQLLARAVASPKRAQRALLRQAFEQAAEAESAVNAAGLMGAAPGELVTSAATAYLVLGESLEQLLPRGRR